MQPDTHTFIATVQPDFTTAGLDELREVAELTEITGLDEGLMLVEATKPFGAIAQALRRRPPVFLRHICPVQHVVELTGSADDIAAIAAAEVTVTKTYSVQVRAQLVLSGYRPFDVQSAITASRDLDVSVKDPEQVISVVITPTHAYVGASDVSDNLSSWPGGMRRFAREDGQISRAEFKLLEAVEHFGIDLSEAKVALDLGAAPGGWTRVLAARGLDVVAVDPAELDPRLEGVRHLKQTIQTLGPKLLPRADVLVNDMRMDPFESASETARIRHLMAPSGVGVVTFKLHYNDPLPALDEAVAILGDAYQVRGVKQLFHNRHEVTVALRW